MGKSTTNSHGVRSERASALKKRTHATQCMTAKRKPNATEHIRTQNRDAKRKPKFHFSRLWLLLGPKPCKNCESRMSEANPRQSLVKGERLIRYELASAITTQKRSCAKRTFTWGQRSGRKSAANGWTWSKTTEVSQNTQGQSTTTRRPATWLNETTHNRNRINKRKNYS